MKRSVQLSAVRATKPVLGGLPENPYHACARNGPPTYVGSGGHPWMTESDIRSPIDGDWAPSRYGGDPVPTMLQTVSALNLMHPTIEPLFHPKLTHKQKMLRLYKRALHETLSLLLRRREMMGTFGFYARQIRAEFEKYRDADPGTAEWLFVRAVNYIDNKKHPITMNFEYGVGHTAYARYASANADEFTTFPHGFDPDESRKLLNAFERFGIPYMGAFAHNLNPHTFAMRPRNALNPRPIEPLLRALSLTALAVGLAALAARTSMGAGVSSFVQPEDMDKRDVPDLRHMSSMGAKTV
eukprot:Rhum_TRINITY_DN18603_c0_g1::Rhum_TRINITY_DN18603_c0_g1_i1::g.167834::m.167834